MRMGFVILLCFTIFFSSNLASEKDLQLTFAGRLGYGEFRNLTYLESLEKAYISSSIGLFSWSINNPTTLSTVKEFAEGVSFIISLDEDLGTFIVALDDGTILKFSAQLDQFSPLFQVDALINTISVSLDKQLMSISMHSGDVVVWDLMHDAPIEVPEDLQGPAIFSPTSSTLIGSADGKLMEWNYRNNEIHTVQPIGFELDEDILGIAFTDDGSLVAQVTRGGKFYMWSIQDKRLIQELDFPACCPASIRFSSRRNSFFVAFDNFGVMEYQIGMESAEQRIALPGIKDFRSIENINAMITITFTGNLTYWGDDFLPIYNIANPVGQNDSVAYTDASVINVHHDFTDQRLVVTHFSESGVLTNLINVGFITNIKLDIASDVSEFAYVSRFSSDTSIRRVDMITNEEIDIIKPALDSVNDFQYDSTNRYIAIAGRIGNEGAILIYDSLLKTIISMETLSAPVELLRWYNQEKQLAYVLDNGTLFMWDMASNNFTQVIETMDKITDFNISNQDRYLVVATQSQMVYQIDLLMGSIEQFRISMRPSAINFSDPINHIIIGSEDGILSLWDNNGDLLSQVKAHSSKITSISSTSIATRIVTLSNDYSLKLWDLN